MPKRSSAWGNWGRWLSPIIFLVAGCATPQYAIRPTPVPEESDLALEIERGISQMQGQEFDKQGARLIGPWETVAGFRVQDMINRLSRVSERPSLPYQAYLYTEKDPNAAALADGRIYISNGLLAYLESRGSVPDELAFILGHEIAHTVAQHLVKRYRALQQQQLVMAIVAAGTSALTRGASASAQQAGELARTGAQILQDVRNSGYSQEQELEADQLGVRYVIRAKFDPRKGLEMLKDFERFDSPQPIMRSHPYIALRRAYLERYLQETGHLASVPQPPTSFTAGPFPRVTPPPPRDSARLRALRETQKSYPRGSVSWKNLQAQIDALESR